MRFAVEAWAPDYGAPIGGDDELTASSAIVDHEVEVPLSAWTPCQPAATVAPPACVVFTDGVRRVDAQVWVEDDDRRVRPGICASYAAGAVRCDGRAEVVAVAVQRGLFTAAASAETITTMHGPFEVRAAAGDTTEQLSLCLQQRMSELEVEVARGAGPADLVCVDGPLRASGYPPATVGYIKTHRVRYLAPAADDVVARLAAGQRTPLFLVSAPVHSRFSWYVRLPFSSESGGGHPWAGVVRCEMAADVEPGTAISLADQVTVALPRFASAPQKDPRAPQNLYPIGGLERALRHRLGDAAVLYRALRRAAAGGIPVHAAGE